MSRVNPADPLVSLMRAQMAALRKRGLIQAGPDAAAKGRAPHGSLDDLAHAGAERIRHLDPNDPDRPRKAIRIFLEAVLQAELGGDLVNDADFPRMVEHVQQQLESHPATAAALSSAAQALLDAAA